MYAIQSAAKNINGERIDTFVRGISERDTLIEVEAGTNGYRGGDRQSGSRCYLRIEALTRADFFARVRSDDTGKPLAVEVCFCGDDGLTALMKALSFASDAITDQVTGQNS